jgi:hypothetical protein
VTARSSAWLTWLVVCGLIAVFVGERMVPGILPARFVFSGGGTLAVLAALVWRAMAVRRSSGDAQKIERLFLLTYAGCAVSLVLFFLAGDALDWVGVDLDDADSAARFETITVVLACIILAASLLPAIAAQLALPAVRDDAATASVDRMRITQLALGGLAVGLAGSFLFLTGYVASQRDSTLDLSYFRTASPGTAAQQIVESLGSPLRVVLFFPPANEVKDQLLGYFRALEGSTGNVQLEEHDRLAAPEIAEEYNVNQDGMVVLAVGDRSERMTFSTEINSARTRLRSLDEEVQRTLMRVAREERTIYLTVGHGEINDPSSSGALEEAPFRRIDAMRNLFRLLNYRVEDLGVQSGLGNEVPSDAAMVLVLGPSRPFLEPELQAIDRYLERGGSALIALEPEGDFQLGPLRDRLGVDYSRTVLADDRQHLRQRGNISDRRLIVTDRFTSHASVSTLGGAGVGSGILLVGSGHLETIANSRATPVIRSLASTFADVDGDFEFDGDGEERKAYTLAAAVENREPAQADSASDSDGMRAMVLADAGLFSDAVVSSLGLNAALAADAIRWLGREEELAGETSSEEDVPIVHTRNEDVLWFYSTILGAPALVLLLGLLSLRNRRRRPANEGTQTVSPAPEGEA